MSTSLGSTWQLRRPSWLSLGRRRRAGRQRIELVVRQSDWQTLRDHLFGDTSTEQHAFVFCGVAQTRRLVRLLVRDVVPTPRHGFEVQSGAYLRLNKEYHRRVLLRCRDEGLSLLEVHSHPFGDGVAFSSIDRGNDERKFRYVGERLPGIRHATMVCSPTGAVMAHAWDPAARRIRRVDEILVMGRRLERIGPDGRRPGSDPAQSASARYARQVLAFGAERQYVLSSARVGIVGLSGNGSPLAMVLGRLGVGRFVLVDPDAVEESNLSRIVGATPRDIGRPKVDVAAREIRRANPDARIRAVRRSVLDAFAAQALKGVDLLVGATDSASSRMAMTVLARRYLVPYLDLGLRIEGEKGILAHAFGQVRLAHPDGPCLVCLGGVDPVQARCELDTSQERALRQAAGYGTGMLGPVPSIMPLNTTIASLAAWQAVGTLTGAFAAADCWHLDLLAPRLLPITHPATERDCVRCGASGEDALGDLLPWPRWAAESLPANLPLLAETEVPR